MLIEDHALLGDLGTAALVDRAGTVDWLCLPRFDSPSVFASLLGDASHGCWTLGPASGEPATRRRYRPGTPILESEWETGDGAVRVTDFMPRRGPYTPRLMRIVEGLRGRVTMRTRLTLRPDYGAVSPWLDPVPDGVTAMAGPDAFRLSTPIPLTIGHDHVAAAEFTVVEGARERLTLSWWPSHETPPPIEDADSALARTDAWWRRWSERCTYDGPYREAVVCSLVALKAMTHEATGGIVAAPTTSLPEDLGGVRNWDYRYCWLRDSVLTLEALVHTGYAKEALAFRDFLLRAATGDPDNAQIMYGVGGERRLPEFELDLPGYEGSRPVRIGNAASEQVQLDVYGEVLGAAWIAVEHGAILRERNWPRWVRFLEHLRAIWRDPDDGIWEARGPQRHYTYSKVMAWVAFDRAVRIAERFERDGPLDEWRAARDEIHAEVCARGYDPERRTFTQYYGSRELDASVLNIPLVGFLPAGDERVRGTIDAVLAHLTSDGLVARYSTDETDDGLPGGEGRFLACSFWLVSALAHAGRREEASALFERLLALRSDLGLLAEEYDAERGRQVGNFPQAFSHLTLINAARALEDAPG